MPILHHAKKKLRQDKKRTARNRVVKSSYKELVKTASVEKTAKSVSEAFSAIDKAVKNHLLHKNKGGHMKSALSKILDGKAPVASTKTTPKAKTTKPKSATKKSASAKKTTKKA